MATSGIANGLHYITIGGTQITHLINVDYNVTNNLRNITTKESTGNAEEWGGGTISNVMTAQAYFAEDAGYGFNELQAACVAATTVSIVFTTGVSGDVKWTASAKVANVGQVSPNLDGSGTVDVTFNITGVVTEGTET